MLYIPPNLINHNIIWCNGAPKTGTHLLLNAVYHLGVHKKRLRHEHKYYDGWSDWKNLEKPQLAHLHIIRHPKNVLISYVRYTFNECSEKHVLDNIPNVIDDCRVFVKWLYDKEVLTVKFENMLKNDKTLKNIAKFIGVPFKKSAFLNMTNKVVDLGFDNTKTNKHSNWQDWWSDRHQDRWIEYGGPQLEIDLGYGNNSH